MPVSEAEQRVLSLYDRLRELQLELALLTARHEHVPGCNDQTQLPPSPHTNASQIFVPTTKMTTTPTGNFGF